MSPPPGAAIPPAFDLFVGVDWSGARGPRLPGLQVAVCRPGNAPPLLLDRPWTRRGLLDWLAGLPGRTAIGTDCAFAHAWLDEAGYFPGLPGAPDTPFALWEMVEEACADLPDFYAGLFARRTAAGAGAHYLAAGHRGARYRSRRRLTELACGAALTWPTSTFHGVGPSGVGTGSLAAMRFARAARARGVAVWPFEPPARQTLFEIFPRAYYVMAGGDPRGNRDLANLNAILAFYGSAPVAGTIASEDQGDALVAAAAIRWLSLRPAAWRPPAMTGEAAAREGWIFGVGS